MTSRGPHWSAEPTWICELPVSGWRANHQIRVPWGWVYADIAFPLEKVVVELDGWEFHQSRTSFVSDRRRDVALHLAGWSVLRFTADSMEELIPQLRDHLKARGVGLRDGKVRLDHEVTVSAGNNRIWQ